MTDDNQNVTVVGTSYLFPKDIDRFRGFMPAAEKDFESIILDKYKSRQHLSPDHPSFRSYTQIVTCCIIFNPETESIACYKQKDFDSSNLKNDSFGLWTICRVNHLDSVENLIKDPSVGSANPIKIKTLEDLKKNISVERGFIDANKMHLLGYIHNDNNYVSRAHLGMVYVIPTNASLVAQNDVKWNTMMSIPKLEHMIEQSKDFRSNITFDFWTLYSLKPLKEYLNEKYPANLE